MRKLTLIPAALLLIGTVACETKTEKDVTIGDGSTVSSTTVSTNVPAIDTTATAEMKADMKEAGRDAKAAAIEAGKDVKEAGREAAHATGTALEKAGKKIQKHSKPGNQP